MIRVFVAFSVLSGLSLVAQQTSLPFAGNAAAAVTHPAAHPLTIDVEVTDKSGTPVRGLQAQDFTLLEDKQPKGLLSVRAVDLDAGSPAPPVEVVLVVDAINADPIKMAVQREGVKEYLRANGGKLPLPVSLVVLSDAGIGQPAPASRDGNQLASLLDAHTTGLRQVKRSTEYGSFERFEMSLHALHALTVLESAKPGRKLLVWVSPGWPLLANATPDVSRRNQEQLFRSIVETSTMLRENHITLYHLESRGIAGSNAADFSFYTQFLKGVKSPSQAYPPNLALSVLAVQSGGLVLNESNDLPAVMAKEIAKSESDARAFYVLQFDAANAEHADEYHALQVRLDKAGLTARTRTGYYSQP